MSEVNKNLGHATAYGYAKSQGYAGTEEEFAALMAGYADVGQRAETAATAAADSAAAAKASENAAKTSETIAASAALTATTASQNASESATAASASATAASASAVTASSAATAASGSASTASAKASEASGSATAASASAAAASVSASSASASASSAAVSASSAESAAASLVIDPTLSHADQAADAKVTGDEISTLKSQLQAINDLDVIALTSGYYIETNVNVGAVVDLTPVSSSAYANGGYAIINCEPGDAFIVSGEIHYPKRLWCFIDADNKVLTRSAALTPYKLTTIYAPEKATKLVFLSLTNELSIKGLTAAIITKKLSEEMPYALNGIPTASLRDMLSRSWNGHGVVLSAFFLPFTVKKKLLLYGIHFTTTFTSSCTLYVLIVDKDQTTVYTKAETAISASGEQDIDITIPVVLEPGEYRIILNVTAGSIYYPVFSDRPVISDDYIENTGTAYQSNNDQIRFVGALTYSDGKHHELTVPLDQIVFKDPDVSNHVFVSQNEAVTISNDVITFNYTQSSGLASNVGFRYGVLKDELINGLVEISGTATLNNNSKLIVYIHGTKTDNSDFFKSLGLIESSGDFDFVADVNSFAMYYDLDLTKAIDVQVGMYTRPCFATVSNFQISTPKYYLDGNKSFYENINEMTERIESNTNSIAILSQAEYLTSPDGNKYILNVSNSGVLSAVPIIPDKVLFVGNSFLLGQERLFGMAASDADHDYYHYVTQAILAKKPTATFTKLLGVSFEQATSVADAESWMQSTLLPELNSDLNLVLVQLAENVATTEMKNVFAVTCAEMIQYIKEHAPNARVAWAGSYYSSGSTNRVVQTIAEACASKGAVFIDTSALPKYMSYIGAVIHYGVVQTRTYSMDSYVDDSTNHTLTVTFTVGDNQYTATDVPYNSYTTGTGTISITGEYGFLNTPQKANHPSDAGMLEIANKMITALGFN